MALKAKTMLAQPALLPNLLLPLMLIYVINFVISTLIGKALFKQSDAIALAITVGVFGENCAGATLLIALAYIVQVQAAAWYVKFASRMFGEQPLSESAKSAQTGSKPIAGRQQNRPQ